MSKMPAKEELLKIAKPILFNTEMTRAIMDGRKSQTRRVITKKVKRDTIGFELYADTHIEKTKRGLFGGYKVGWVGTNRLSTSTNEFIKPKYKVGDILYVRETWCRGKLIGDGSCHREYWSIDTDYDDRLFYKADTIGSAFSDEDNLVKWKPSIHMPKKYARTFIKITGVRVERLQDIEPDDILSEGMDFDNYIPIDNGKTYTADTHGEVDYCEDVANEWWSTLWNSTAPKSYKWEDNPWVFVYEFEVVDYAA